MTLRLNQAALQRVSQGKDVRRLMDRVGGRVALKASQIAPVDTGQLRRSMRVLTTESRGTVSTFVIATTDYAVFVELGTSRMAAQPYLRPALALARV